MLTIFLLVLRMPLESGIQLLSRTLNWNRVVITHFFSSRM